MQVANLSDECEFKIKFLHQLVYFLQFPSGSLGGNCDTICPPHYSTCSSSLKKKLLQKLYLEGINHVFTNFVLGLEEERTRYVTMGVLLRKNDKKLQVVNMCIMHFVKQYTDKSMNHAQSDC